MIVFCFMQINEQMCGIKLNVRQKKNCLKPGKMITSGTCMVSKSRSINKNEFEAKKMMQGAE